jgi:calcium/calmodulin-dependent protein kinase I
MVMELCEPFTLYDKIVQRPFLDGEVASLMKKLLEALSHCHMLRVVH